MNRMSLKFLSNDSCAELFESEFSCSLVGRNLRCVRGRQAFTDSVEGTFVWSSAVQSMSAVVIKSKIAELTRTSPQAWPQAAGLCSDSTSWALSLDFALFKKPRWLLDMFGVDSLGTPIIKRLFIRMNPEKKRPGPSWVSINPAFLDPRNIAIFLDGIEVTTAPELTALLKLIGLESPGELVHTSGSKVVKPASKAQAFPNALRGVPVPSAINSNTLSLSFSISDAVLHVVDQEQLVKKRALAHRLRDLYGQSISPEYVELAVLSLSRRGIIQVEKDLVSLNPTSAGGTRLLFSDLTACAQTLSARISTESERSIRFEFSSLSQLDEFLGPLYNKCLARTDGSARTWWHLNHSLWPLLRPQAECQRALDFATFRNTSYLSLGTSPVDAWVQRFYKKLGVEGCLRPNSPYSFDFWLIGDFYIEHNISSPLLSSINHFMRSFSSVEDFDNMALEKGFYQTAEKCGVVVHFAPGLTESMREQLMSLSANIQPPQGRTLTWENPSL